MTLPVRPLRPEDAPACYDIWYRSVREGAGRFYDAAQRAAWMPHAAMPEGFPARVGAQTGWVAEDDTGIVGFFTVEADGHLDLAYVAPEWMGRGVAGVLHAALIDWARARRLPRLRTEASQFFRRFLLRHGWQVTAAETVHRNGVALERFRMDIVLGPAP